MRHFLLAVLLACPAAAETAGALDVARPAQWDRRNDEASGASTFFPYSPERAPNSYVLILPPEKTDAKAKDWLDAAWKGTVAGSKILSGPDAAKLGPWRHCSAQVEGAAGKRWVRLYAVKTNLGMQGALFMAETKELFDENVKIVDAMLGGANWPGKPLPKNPKVKEAWRGAIARLRADSSSKGSSMIAETEHLVLFENHTAVWGWPERGIASEDWNGDPAVQGDLLGTWTETADGIRFKWSEGSETVVTRKEDRLTEGDTGSFFPVLMVDGSRPEGTFERHDQFAQNRVSLHADGTFEEDNLLALLPNLTEEKLPAKGKGTYEIRAWTLLLTYSDGTTKTIAYEVTSGTADKPGQIALASYILDLKK